MTIAEVSRSYGLSPDTLRYYERIGMIPPVHRAPNGQRDYTEEDCRWVELARCMRSAGLPVEAMIRYVALARQGDSTLEARRELLAEQREQLFEQQRTIEGTIQRLNYKIAHYDDILKTGVCEPAEQEGE